MRRHTLSTPRTRTWRAVLFLVAILLVPACEDGGEPIGPVATVPTVAGTVISSANGTPVAGAEVSIGAAGATSGADGRFELTGLTPGPARLRTIADGFPDFEADIIVTSGAITRDVQLTPVEPVTTVTGRVSNAVGGGAVAGAIVSIGPATATTGPNGRFELAGLTPGPATLRCIADGFEDFEAEITVPSGGMTRMIPLTSVAPLLIHADVRQRHVSVAVSQGGVPVKDALVTVNGTAISVLPSHRLFGFPGRYGGQHPVHAGSPLELQVTALGKTVKATATMPETPVLTAPTPGSVFAHTDSITLTWASAADPDSFVVTVGSGFEYDIPVPGNTRELKMAAIGAIGFEIAVRAFIGGSFTGPAHPDSRMTIEGDYSARIIPRVVVFDHVSGVYDLTAPITSFDPAWGDLAGAFYSGVITLSQAPPGAGEFGGTFADWRYTSPHGESTFVQLGHPAVPAGTGSVRGFFTPSGEFIIEVEHWFMHGKMLDSGDIAGTFGCCGHISGTFTARRRP